MFLQLLVLLSFLQAPPHSPSQSAQRLHVGGHHGRERQTAGLVMWSSASLQALNPKTKALLRV
jgi:hypothetical protein